jgi:hypothetical protein
VVRVRFPSAAHRADSNTRQQHSGSRNIAD